MSAPDRVWVLYEDKLADGVKHYGLHQLVLACVFDDLVGQAGLLDSWALRGSIKGHPKNGNTNVISECRKNLERLAKGAGAVVAVLDSDKVCACANVANGSCKQLVLEGLHGQILGSDSSRRDKLEVVLLERNLESVIESIRSIAPELVPDEVFEGALGKSRTDRDRVLMAMASGQPGARTALREAHISFGRLVLRVCRRYSQLP